MNEMLELDKKKTNLKKNHRQFIKKSSIGNIFSHFREKLGHTPLSNRRVFIILLLYRTC